MTGTSRRQLLKGVSRSFYLTLRLLPAPMRGAASVGYLLARTSDTLADAVAAPAAERRECLARFGRAVAGTGEIPRWPERVLEAAGDPRERKLLEAGAGVFAALDELPVKEAALVREVVEIIVSGQTLDLERFADASASSPVALASDEMLDDYAWRVAGCVGAFWTKLGFLTMGERFSAAEPAVLLERGIAYGKGLQLVNILRDVPADLAQGRCYLPVADPRDRRELLECHARWRGRAREWVGEGARYAATLGSRRLRAATALPALLAEKTLEAMDGADWERLERRVKISRGEVYRSLARAFFSR